MADNKNEVVLINPPPLRQLEDQDNDECPHLGLGYLSAYLRQYGFACHPIDAKFEGLDFEKLTRRLKKYRPYLVGITAMTHEIGRAALVARLTKKLFPEAVVVIGGPHATALPEETLRQFIEFDVAAIAEGEITLHELAKGLQLSAIKGIAFRRGSKIELTPAREFVKNLDELPLPAWDLFPASRIYPLISARGCPFHCNFCMRVSGSLVRKRSAKNILGEFQLDADRYGASRIRVHDESFGVDKEQTEELLNALVNSRIAKKVRWIAQTRVSMVNEAFLQKLKAAGCSWIGFGVESGNEDTLKGTGKGITLKSVENAVALAKKAGLQTGSFFIIGHPYETRQTALDTINFAVKLNTTTLALGIMVPYPGTEIYKMALKGEGGYKIISSDWADFNKTIGSSLELETLSRKEMEKLQLLGYFLFYFKNWRFLEFFKLLWKERKVVWAITRKIFT